MTRINRWVSALLGRATAPQNPTTSASAGSTRPMPGASASATRSAVGQAVEARNPKAYRVLRPVLAVVVAALYRWLF
jgi:beta-hydroxylase